MKSFQHALALSFCGLALAGCEEGRKSLPNTGVFVVHAAPSYLNISFLREERVETGESGLSYSTASAHSFDADAYDFNIEISPPGSTAPERIATFSESLSVDSTYYFILTENGGGIDPVVVEEPAFDTSSGQTEVSFFHAAPALGEVDVYLEPSGTDLAAATPVGTIGFGDRIEPATFAPEGYRMSLTEPGAPGSVVYRSGSFTTSAGQDNMLVITDGANETRAPANAVLLNASPARLADVNTPPALRVINGANDREARDVVVDEDFDSPLFPAVPFATASDYKPIDNGERNVTITPAGNPGVLELEETFAAQPSGAYTFAFTGTDSAGLAGDFTLDDRRPIADTARVRLVNIASQFEQLDMLVVEPGAALSDASPQLQLGAPAFSQLASLVPGEYKLGLREPESETIVAGPVSVTLSERSIYTIVAVDGADANSAELLLLDDFE